MGAYSISKEGETIVQFVIDWSLFWRLAKDCCDNSVDWLKDLLLRNQFEKFCFRQIRTQ